MSGVLQHNQPATLPTARRTSWRAARRGPYGALIDLHHLKIIGIVLPVLFVMVIEVIRFTVVEVDIGHARGHLVLGAVSIVSIVAFASLMFFLIGRANRLIVRQNQELAAVNAVSTAVRGDLGVDQIIDAALDSVLAASGAVEASVTAALPGDGRPAGEPATWRRGGDTAHAAVAGADSTVRMIDIPLSANTSILGRMRLHLPAERGEPDRLTADTLRNIGQQIGSAIQHAQLFADLQRRKREGHALYDVLLRISNRSAPVDTLAGVVRYARDLLGSDEAMLCLNDAASRLVQLEENAGGVGPPTEGPVCVAPATTAIRAAHARACPVRSSTEYRATLTATLDGPDGPYGRLWIGRRGDAPFTERDRGYLETLSEIAVIAITSARMRDTERQAAIIAERERIAREMHDSLAQVLGVAHLRLRALAGQVAGTGAARTPPRLEAELSDLAGICYEAYQDVREAILGLRESTRTDRALLDSLRAYLDKFSRQSGIQATLDSGDTDLVLSPRCEVQLIRVIQEALTNVRKHSGAGTAVVRIIASSAAMTFVVEDDGHGFDPGALGSGRDGFGLLSMRERMKLLNGSLTIDSEPGRGTRVIARLPGACRAPSSVEPAEVIQI